MYALVADRSCLIYPIRETSHIGKSKKWKREDLTLLYDVVSLSAVTVVSSTTARLCWFYTEHVDLDITPGNVHGGIKIGTEIASGMDDEIVTDIERRLILTQSGDTLAIPVNLLGVGR
ncbi:hypothetical protein EVAR_33558_1 [Eumeta japonica]|uniref:Uncharacterized protein n=1 Tax=Eumeta variegata TaxID=151549 RepID=A0A4C1VKI8_EUMVA|nr:hypothetical protein EVAR_33558_1 [Eumeta japonica]